MENASKALLMTGGILIGIIILSLGVYLFSNSSRLNAQYQQQQQMQEIEQINSQFAVYPGEEDITIHDIVTVVNLAKEQNESDPTEPITVRMTKPNLDLTNMNINDIIPQYIDANFICKSIIYRENNGKIQEIIFEQKT